MTTRDKPVLKLVIDLIQKNGPMTVRDIMSELLMTQNAVSKRCYDARNAGYLTMTFEREREMVGRKGAIYTRTAKPFDKAIASPKTIEGRERKRRDRENEMARKLRVEAAKMRNWHGKPFIPFRHPHDAWFFGPSQFTGQASTVPCRTVEQWSRTMDEEESCQTA